MDAWTDKLDLYLDGELSAQEASSVAEHIRQCSECASDVIGRLMLKREVRFAGRRYQPENAFRQRMRAQLEPRKAVPVWRLTWVGAAAVIVIATALIVLSALSRKTPVELADLHVTALASASPVEVASSDRHTVKPWFQGKIPFTFNLPELNGSDFSLLGGRLVYWNQAPAAQLIYQIRQHKLSVFIVQGRDVPPLPHGARKDLTFNIESWQAGGLEYVIIGDAGMDDIRRLAGLLRSAEQQ